MEFFSIATKSLSKSYEAKYTIMHPFQFFDWNFNDTFLSTKKLHSFVVCLANSSDCFADLFKVASSLVVLTDVTYDIITYQ